VDLTEVTSLAGFGMRASTDSLELRVGRRTWVAPDSAAADPETHGVSEVWVAHGTLIGRLILRDEIRPEAPRLIAALHALGLRALVLTGDRAAAAAHLQSTLGLDDVRGELTPAQKLDAIRDLGAVGCRAAMIGDGINDAPSIAAAHVGVAMGARGSDAALEQADVVLMHDRLENFLGAYALSGTARRIIRQNLAISLGVIVILVLLASLQKLTLSLGVLGHEGSTAVVVLNSLRLFRAPASLTPKKAAGVIPSAMR
jgi:Cd2+/Zn2+-exporting ATPase